MRVFSRLRAEKIPEATAEKHTESQFKLPIIFQWKIAFSPPLNSPCHAFRKLHRKKRLIKSFGLCFCISDGVLVFLGRESEARNTFQLLQVVDDSSGWMSMKDFSAIIVFFLLLHSSENKYSSCSFTIFASKFSVSQRIWREIFLMDSPFLADIVRIRRKILLPWKIRRCWRSKAFWRFPWTLHIRLTIEKRSCPLTFGEQFVLLMRTANKSWFRLL